MPNIFGNRHIGKKNIKLMLDVCRVNSIDALIKEVIPNIQKINLPYFPPSPEHESLEKIKKMSDKNKQAKNYIGMGFTSSILPNVIKRNILENPKWYTAYTPYQAEISQGRLESLYNYQDMICSLTQMDVANASLLDEASTASEVVNMMKNSTKNKKKDLYVCENLHPYVLDTLITKSKAADINLFIDNFNDFDYKKLDNNTLGIMFQYPDTYGLIDIPKTLLSKCKENSIITSCSTNLLALTQYKPPGEFDIDICFGNAGNFGIPLWFGGPHPAFLSCKHKYIRTMPGRIIGKTIDKNNKTCFRISLQTREQHIRKEKATSNICTSQALLANVASMYGIYNGAEGLIDISHNIIKNTNYFRTNLDNSGITYLNKNQPYFDTTIIKDSKAKGLYTFLKHNNILTRQIDKQHIGITFDETTTEDYINELIFMINDYFKLNISKPINNPIVKINNDYKRKSKFLENETIYNKNTETEMLRYITYLVDKDYTLCDGMIPLGSCTMKLNSSTQLLPLSWDNICNIHPYSPPEFYKGYKEIIHSLSEKLKEITGLDNISYQSNSGAMGEYSGLLCVKKYHEFNKETQRNICIIPESAHGTNFSSAHLSGFEIIKFNDKENIEIFKKLIEDNRDRIGCLMITYPGTDGIFQDNITEIINIIHNNGGLVYMDGANMNAMVGITNPGICGADVCHLNLHKTFCIPHGGGGPGMGPILCNNKLKDFLPNNYIQTNENNNNSIGNISSSQWSSASLLTIPLIYILSMGSNELKESTKIAILNANYLKNKLDNHYTINTNKNGRVGHEFIIDTSEFSKYNIRDVDIAKRMIDYNFHPGTMSWPRKNVIMIEPTESENKDELDRFVSAMISIKEEITHIKNGIYTQDNNPLKNAPHSLDLLRDEWKYPYSMKQAYYPNESLYEKKKFPTIGRVNDNYGDKNILKPNNI